MAEGTSLTTVRGGINRLRTKGAAPEDSLFDLVNGYVTAARKVQVRPGTFRRATLPTSDTTGLSATKGLCAFNGSLHVFASESVSVPAGFTVHVIRRPGGGTDSYGATIALSKIHFAAPFMGFLYVVAEFEIPDPVIDDLGNVFHFWLQTGDTWEANTVYKLGQIVEPSIPNGLAYRATRLTAPAPAWAPGVLRAIGDVIEPTVYNDFFYTVVDTQGTNPRSGQTEPVWPTEDGAQVFEDADSDNAPGQTPATTEQPAANSVPNPTTRARYSRGLLP